MKFKLNILLIGAGRAGSMLLRLFNNDPTIHIVGVVDKNTDAPGVKIAREMGLPISTNYHQFLSKEADLIINVTGDADLQEELRQIKPRSAELIGGISAMLIWSLLDQYKKKEILEEHFSQMRKELEKHSEEEFIIGKTRKMQEIMNMITRVAATPTTVMIRGESGTGKEVVARMIHKSSERANRPLIIVNCTSFSPALIESELFGYKKGAFTGALSDQIGLLELADEGTVFLDEIGDMPLEMQSKLLRFLQSGEIRPVGANTTRKVDVRIIAATNRDLEDAIEGGEFRKDLYYRLNAFTITMPPLRERKIDIPILAYHFLKKAQAKTNKRVSKISPAALAALSNYHWPGNLRELENIIERAVVLTSSDTIELEHLPLMFQPQATPESLDTAHLKEGIMALKSRMIARFEYEAICRYLSENNGNVTRAAQAARVPRRTFQRLMAKHQISAEMFKTPPKELMEEK